MTRGILAAAVIIPPGIQTIPAELKFGFSRVPTVHAQDAWVIRRLTFTHASTEWAFANSRREIYPVPVDARFEQDMFIF